MAQTDKTAPDWDRIEADCRAGVVGLADCDLGHRDFT